MNPNSPAADAAQDAAQDAADAKGGFNNPNAAPGINDAVDQRPFDRPFGEGPHHPAPANHLGELQGGEV